MSDAILVNSISELNEDLGEDLIYDNSASSGKGEVVIANEETLSKYKYVKIIYYLNKASSNKTNVIIVSVDDMKNNKDGTYPFSYPRLYISINASYADYVYRSLKYISGRGLVLTKTTGDGVPVSGYLLIYKAYGLYSANPLSASCIPYGYVMKVGNIAFSNKGSRIPLAISAKGYTHSTSSTGQSSAGNITLYAGAGNKELVTSETTMSGNQHTTIVNKWIGSSYFWIANLWPLVGGLFDIDKLKTVTGVSTGGNIVCWLEKMENESKVKTVMTQSIKNKETEVEVHEL